MTFDEFVKKYNGKTIDYDGGCGVQCVDLAKLYMDKVLGIKIGAIGNAHAYYDNFDKVSTLNKNFTRIKNTASFVPKKGDIAVWSKSMNGYGHIAICTGEGDTKHFYTYDQNWNGKSMKKVKHTYNYFNGVLRPKKQNTSEYKTGTYVVTASLLNVRNGAGVNHTSKKYNQLTSNAQEQNKKLGNEKANGYLKGVICTVTKVLNNWGLTASGWICLDYCASK